MIRGARMQPPIPTGIATRTKTLRRFFNEWLNKVVDFLYDLAINGKTAFAAATAANANRNRTIL
jgi:hypothetical protein